MIIACQNCNKRFDVDQNLIPKKGRLLQCNSCDHKWFFRNEIIVKTIKKSINKDMKIFESKSSQDNDSLDLNNNTNLQNQITLPVEDVTKKLIINKVKVERGNILLNLTIVFMISFIALILLLDTFRSPLVEIFPKLDFFLYNLYETIRDIRLFIIDLI